MNLLADKAISGFTVNQDNLTKTLAANPILVTALNKTIGYEKGAAIKQAYAEKRPVVDVAKEMTDLSDEKLKELLIPLNCFDCNKIHFRDGKNFINLNESEFI